MKKSFNILSFTFLLLFLFSVSSFARGGYKPRNIDRALYFTDIVLRSLYPSTVVVNEPAVTQTSTVYSTTGSTTTTTVVTTPVYTAPVVTTPVITYSTYSAPPIYVAPRIRYTTPRYHYSAPRRPTYKPRPSHRPSSRPQSRPSNRPRSSSRRRR